MERVREDGRSRDSRRVGQGLVQTMLVLGKQTSISFPLPHPYPRVPPPLPREKQGTEDYCVPSALLGFYRYYL